MADLTPYVPRLLLQWEERFGGAKHQTIDGTLVFADVSGFTKLSEALARKSGKAGAEEMADVINYLFGELLMLAAVRGGEMLKYGGDAMLLFFNGDAHALRAAAACADMQRRLRQIGRVDTGGAGIVRLRMSVGAHSGSFDFFVAGRCHRELLVAGPDTTVTVAMEAAADATEVLVSPAMAAHLPARNVGAAKDGGLLLRGNPKAPLVETSPLDVDVDAAQFLAGPLVRHLSSEGASPEHRLSTVAFLQFMELDSLLDAGRADDAAMRIDDVLSLVQETFLEFGVTFLATDLAADGGKVMAASGAPAAHGDDEERMLRACRRILDASPALPVRIGLNRGHVFAGDVGPRFRRTYTTLGDVTNTAARVMGKASAGELLALRPVLDRSAQRFVTAERPPFTAKGKSEPLIPFSVGDVTDTRIDLSGDLPLIGRDREVTDVAGHLAALIQSGGAVVVVGEEGMGKSRVAREAVRQVDVDHVLATSASEHERGVPYGALRGIVPRLEACAGVTSLAPWMPLLAMVHGAQVDPTPEVEALDATAIANRLSTVVLDAIAAHHPGKVVLHIDDIHTADRASIDIVERMASARRGGLAILATSEPGVTLGSADAVVTVGPLAADDAKRLVRAVAGIPLLPQHVATIVARGDGNPLFLTELARSFRADRAALPESIESTIAARIDELPAASRVALRTAAVVGSRFDPAFVAALLGHEPPWEQLDEHVDIDIPGGVGRFRHEAARAAAYEGLPFSARRQLHARAAQMLEAAGASADVLSVHFAAGADHERAWRYGLDAGRQARTFHAHADAVLFFERALASERHVQLTDDEAALAWRDMGLAQLDAGETAAARRSISQARRRAGSLLTLVNLFVLEADVLLRAGEPRAAERRCQRGLRLIAAAGESPAVAAQRARLKTMSANCLRQRGSFQRARALCSDAAIDARKGNDGRVEMHARSLEHLIAVTTGAPDREACGREAMRLAERHGTPAERGRVANNIALDLQMQGDFGGAAPLFEQARQLFVDAGTPLEAGAAANNLAEIYIELGRFDDADMNLREALEVFEAAGTWWDIIALANLATAAMRSGRLDDAGDHLARAFGRAEAVQMNELVADLTARQAELDALRSGAAVEDDQVRRERHGASAV